MTEKDVVTLMGNYIAAHSANIQKLLSLLDDPTRTNAFKQTIQTRLDSEFTKILRMTLTLKDRKNVPDNIKFTDRELLDEGLSVLQ